MKARASSARSSRSGSSRNVCVLEPIRFTPDELDFLLTRHGDRLPRSAFWNQFEHADTFGSLIQPDPELTSRLELTSRNSTTAGTSYRPTSLDWAERVVEQATVPQPARTPWWSPIRRIWVRTEHGRDC